MSQFSIADFVRAPSGLFVLDVFQGGELVEHIEEPNLIVDGSKQAHAKLIGGSVTNQSVTQIGYGTSGLAPSTGNTALTGAYTKAIDSASYPTSNQVQFNFSLGTGEANGMSILEFGLITGGGVLYARKVRSVALPKTSGLTLSGAWTITF